MNKPGKKYSSEEKLTGVIFSHHSNYLFIVNEKTTALQTQTFIVSLWLPPGGLLPASTFADKD